MAQEHDRQVERPAARKWTRLPDPIRLEDTITSAQSLVYPQEKDDYWREVEWMLKTSAGI
jgi:hypothetical protein